tara:strand:+ start:85 stop:465 length:381 start_codon:yes stop_codon:yes gene_type:complete
MIPKIRKIKSMEELEATVEAAKQDNDNMLYPSHIITKDDKIVGGWSLGAIPLVMVWNDREACSARESITHMHTIDAIMNDRGNKQYMIACNPHSPYFDKMEKLGYGKGWPTNLFLKNISGGNDENI